MTSSGTPLGLRERVAHAEEGLHGERHPVFSFFSVVAAVVTGASAVGCTLDVE